LPDRDDVNTGRREISCRRSDGEMAPSFTLMSEDEMKAFYEYLRVTTDPPSMSESKDDTEGEVEEPASAEEVWKNCLPHEMTESGGPEETPPPPPQRPEGSQTLHVDRVDTQPGEKGQKKKKRKIEKLK
jgi:hypothetical protein